MKRIVYYALAAGLVLGAGCSKENEDGTQEPMTAEEIAVKTQETAVQATEKAAEVTAQVEETTKEVSKKTQEAATALTVKAEDVMGDLNRSVDEVKQKVAAFDKNQLMAYADTYKDVILEKKDQLAALTEDIKGLSAMEVIGEKGKALKAELSKYTTQLTALKARYSVYLEQLKAFGVDLSAYGL